MNVTFTSTPLRSRFGRRLLILFVGCALVPMAVLAVLSYRHVKQQLYRQSETRLQQANRALAQAVFERLLLLDATLKSIPPRAILQLDAAKRLPRTSAPQRKPRPKLGNQTQAGGADGRRSAIVIGNGGGAFWSSAGARLPIFDKSGPILVLPSSAGRSKM